MNTPSKKTIMVVEDSGDCRKLFQMYLEGLYNVICAKSVDEALEKLEKQEVDLITLDIALRSKQTGIDLAKMVRQSDKWNNIPIIAVTAHVLATDRDNCLAAGCNEFQTKPIARSSFLAAIKRYI